MLRALCLNPSDLRDAGLVLCGGSVLESALRATPLPLSITTTSSNTALVPQAAITYTAGSSTAAV